MTEQDFIKNIEQGYNLIPLKSTLINNGLDPIDVYQKLSNMPKSYLFESLEGKKDWSRYTIIGLPSEEYIELKIIELNTLFLTNSLKMLKQIIQLIG